MVDAMKKDNDLSIKAEILYRLIRRRCWGAKYFPVDLLVRWISRKVVDGKRVRRLIKQLIDDGYVLPHKKGKTISLNPHKSAEIVKFIEKYRGF